MALETILYFHISIHAQQLTLLVCYSFRPIMSNVAIYSHENGNKTEYNNKLISLLFIVLEFNHYVVFAMEFHWPWCQSTLFEMNLDANSCLCQ